MVFFDIDGTLVPGTSSSQYLASFLGHRGGVAVAERAYANGELDNVDVSVVDAAGWRGHTPDAVRAWLAGLPVRRDLRMILPTLESWANGLG